MGIDRIKARVRKTAALPGTGGRAVLAEVAVNPGGRSERFSLPLAAVQQAEPARRLAERRARTSPLQDVAGLLRSFDHAAAMLPLESSTPGMPSPERRRTAPGVWRRTAAIAFFDACHTVAEAGQHPWLRASGEQGVMDIFLIRKVAYGIGYEPAIRPARRQIPLRGLEHLARGRLA